MAETFEAYIERIRGYSRGKDPMAVLRATPRTLAKRTSGLSRRALTRPPAPGKWSIGQILAHLSEIELLFGYRIRVILEQDRPRLLGMDQNVWARNSRYERLDPGQSLETYRALRRANVELLAGLSPRTLQRAGIHSQMGRVTIKRITELLAGHDLNHKRQVDAILRKKR
jgi:uncharacterized damage-inducible protein DinB